MAARAKAIQQQYAAVEAAQAERVMAAFQEAEEKRRAAREARWVAAGRPSTEESRERVRRLQRARKKSGLEHWRAVLADPHAPAIAKRYAEEAIGHLEAERVEREPGQDDE